MAALSLDEFRTRSILAEKVVFQCSYALVEIFLCPKFFDSDSLSICCLLFLTLWLEWEKGLVTRVVVVGIFFSSPLLLRSLHFY